jgi:hypothetical protein
VTILTRAASFAFAEGHRDDRIRLGKAGGRKGVLIMETIPWSELLKQGIFAALFIALFIYVINDAKRREKEYQLTINNVTDNNNKYADIIKVDLAEIKAKLK